VKWVESGALFCLTRQLLQQQQQLQLLLKVLLPTLQTVMLPRVLLLWLHAAWMLFMEWEQLSTP
jgi:hypothetical protein